METIVPLLRALALALVLVTAAGAVFSATPEAAPLPREYFVYFGSFVREGASLFLSRFDAETGRLTPAEAVASVPRPAFLALHPTGRQLYAVNEVATIDGTPTGAVTGFALDRATGALSLINRVSSKGPGPTHLSVDTAGRHVVVANYDGGSVAVLPIGRDGRLGEATAFEQHVGQGVNPKRQGHPYAHAATFDLASRVAFVCDLGLDRVFVYRLDQRNGTLAPGSPPFARSAPGTGPRHMSMAPGGEHAYVVNEMGQSVTGYRYDARRATLDEIETLPLTESGSPKEGGGAAEVQVHPTGRFVYASNRGPGVDAIVVFARDLKTGKLTRVESVPPGGLWPRHFALDPTGRWLLVGNERSNQVSVFRVDVSTGRLTPTGQNIPVSQVTCVLFAPVAARPAPGTRSN